MICPITLGLLFIVNVSEPDWFKGLLGTHELKYVVLVRRGFAWAYERSCQQSLAADRSTVALDPLEPMCRQALRLAVQQIVLDLQSPTPPVLAQCAKEFAEPADHEKFVQMLGLVLDQLHERIARAFPLLNP